MKKLDAKFKQITGTSSPLQYFAQHLNQVGKPGDFDECQINIEESFQAMEMQLNMTVDNVKYYLDRDHKDMSKSEKDSKVKSFQNDVFKFIDDTLFPYEKCLMVERLDNYTKILDKVQADQGLKKEMKDAYQDARKTLNKLKKINGQTKEQLMEDVQRVHQDMKKAKQAQTKIIKQLQDQGNNYYDDENSKDFVNWNLESFNQYLCYFYETTMEVGLWENGKTNHLLPYDEGKKLSDMGYYL